MKVGECMTRDVRMVQPGDTVQDAAMAMAQCDSGVLPVNEDDRLVGMITDRDIAIRGIACGKGPDAKVRDVMSAEVRYCYMDDSAEDVLQNMSELQVRRLPVLDRDKRLVGIVSLSDLAGRGESAATGEALGQIARPGGEHSQTAH
jgi:CBS-domain-containing membrane protein